MKPILTIEVMRDGDAAINKALADPGGGGLTVTEAAHLLDESIPADVNCLIEPTLKRYSFDRKWRTTYRVHLWRDSLPTFEFCEESDDLHQLTQEAIAAYVAWRGRPVSIGG